MLKPASSARVTTSINIDRVVWREFKTECSRRSVTVTEQTEKLLKIWLNRHRVDGHRALKPAAAKQTS